MSMDTRLLISSIPSLQGAALCQFLTDMNEKEKVIQQIESTHIIAAMQKREPYDNRVELYTIAGGLSFSFCYLRVLFEKLHETSWNSTYSTSKQGTLIGFAVEKSSNYKFSTIGKVLGCAVIVIAFASAYFYHKKADAIQVPNFDGLRRGRLETEIREIVDRIQAGNLNEPERNQLLDALDALKGNRTLFKA